MDNNLLFLFTFSFSILSFFLSLDFVVWIMKSSFIYFFLYFPRDSKVSNCTIQKKGKYVYIYFPLRDGATSSVKRMERKSKSLCDVIFLMIGSHSDAMNKLNPGQKCAKVFFQDETTKESSLILFFRYLSSFITIVWHGALLELCKGFSSREISSITPTARFRPCSLCRRTVWYCFSACRLIRQVYCHWRKCIHIYNQMQYICSCAMSALNSMLLMWPPFLSNSYLLQVLFDFYIHHLFPDLQNVVKVIEKRMETDLRTSCVYCF